MLISMETLKRLKYAKNDPSDSNYLIYVDEGKATMPELKDAIEFDSDTFELFGKHAFSNIEALKVRINA